MSNSSESLFLLLSIAFSNSYQLCKHFFIRIFIFIRVIFKYLWLFFSATFARIIVTKILLFLYLYLSLLQLVAYHR